MKTTGRVLLALGIGAIAGAVLGILYAPDKGSETRKKVSSKAQDLADQLKGMKDSVVNKYKVGHDGRPHAEPAMHERGV